MAESDIGTVRMPVQHALGHASLLVATWPVGKTTRTAGALSAPRSGSGAAARLLVWTPARRPSDESILHQKGLFVYLTCSGSRHRSA